MNIRILARLVVTIAPVAIAGCGSSTPNAGLTNPNPGSINAEDKPAVRSDLPVPDVNAGSEKPLAEAVGSATGTPAADAAATKPPPP
jgi:hypothetical protein